MSSRILLVEEPDSVRREAQHHLGRAYVATLERAESLRYHDAITVPLVPTEESAALAGFADLAAGLRWIGSERENLTALLGVLGVDGGPLAQYAAPLLRDAGYLDDAGYCYQYEYDSYSHLPFEDGRAHALRGLAYLSASRGDFTTAREYYQRARAISRRQRNRDGLVRALRGLAEIDFLTDQNQQARQRLTTVRDLLAELLEAGSDPKAAGCRRWDLAHTLLAIGHLDLGEDSLHLASRNFHSAHEMFEQMGDSTGRLAALCALSEIELRHNDYETAGHHLHEVLTGARYLRDLSLEADALWGLGQIEKATGNYAAAIDLLSATYRIRLARKEPLPAARALLGLAEAQRLAGQLNSAREHYDDAIRRFRHHQDHIGEAECMTGLGDVAAALGDAESAANWWHRALAITEKTGHRRHSMYLRQRLANSDPDPDHLKNGS
jgi:tetratricopeptide (TPR) repeat protein